MVESDIRHRCWIVIPARGGSRGIPRKNLTLCAGKPLIQHVIQTAVSASSPSQVVVITDDEEIVWFASQFGVQTVHEAAQSGPDETLDEKIVRNIPSLRALGARDTDVVLTVQPTSPLLTQSTIRRCYEQLDAKHRSVVTVVEDRHLTWSLSDEGHAPAPLFENRMNRQMIPPVFRETGGVIGARLGDIFAEGTRVVDPVGLVRVSESEGIDIDSFGDLLEAEHWISRAKIVIRADAGVKLGMGHIYRGIAIAQELARHEVIFAIATDDAIAARLLRETPFDFNLVSDTGEFCELLATLQPDLLIVDILNTVSEDVARWKKSSGGMKIVTFEDDGEGAKLCDAQVYDLTSPPGKDYVNAVAGIDKAILAPSFELVSKSQSRAVADRPLLVSFGGSDPAGLTGKVLTALEILEFPGKVTVVTGLGAPKPDLLDRKIIVEYRENVRHMALLVSEHKLAISSMGRTVFELAEIGVPALCFAQNQAESAHIHVGPETGTVFGGLGYELSPDEIATRVEKFLRDKTLHQELIDSSAQFRALRSNREVIDAILAKIGLPLLS